MRWLRIPFPVLFALALSVGCTDDNAPTASSEALPGPSFNFTNGPDVAGIVVRFSISGLPGIIFFDPERLLISLHSSDDGLEGCGPATEFEALDFQRLFSPSGAIHQLLMTTDFVNVYDVTGFPALDCALLTGATGRRLAAGRALFVATDNDIFVSGPGAKAFGEGSAGHLNNLVNDGAESLGYNIMRRFVIKPDGSFELLASEGPALNPDPR